jgi:sodium-dependent phosphate cotransporter
MEEHLLEETSAGERWILFGRNAILFIIGLMVFLFSLELMISSLQKLDTTVRDTILLATSNPFTGLFIGLLVTAIIQSSSATTLITVALVSSGSLSLRAAVPIIMGANIGTTITSTIVSLSFINKGKEFRRAVAAGTFHDFFNILTALILFPLELNFHLLSDLAEYLAVNVFHEQVSAVNQSFLLFPGFGLPIELISGWITNGYVLGTISILLLYGSILFFRKILTNTLGFSSQDKFKRFFFKSSFKSFGWGLLTTALIRSSTVTTSLVVPVVAKKVIGLKQAAPFILGANMGTTLTAIIAAMFNSNHGISIAITHFLFNFIGVLLFFRTPYLRFVPTWLARQLGQLTLEHRIIGFLYLLFTFFIIPFGLIYLSQN